MTPSIYYQNRELHDVSAYWPIYSNPGSNSTSTAIPPARPVPDKFYLPALKIDGDFGAFHLISNTSFYHRQEQTGYDGTAVQPRFLPDLHARRPPVSCSSSPACRFR